MTSRPPSLDCSAALLPLLREALGLAPSPAGDGASPAAGQQGSAWAIDPDRAVVLAATPQGATRLGMSGPEAPMPLDAAMPALRRLREIAVRLQPAQSVREVLLFWTTAGSERIDVEVRQAPNAGGALIVRETATRHAMAADAEPAGSEPVEPPPLPRDDAATLREIARRILAGQRRTSPPSGTAAHVREAGAAPSPPTGALPTASRATASLATAALPTATMAAGPADSAAATTVDIAKLAHELKTPISAIVAASEIMRDERFGSIGNERYRGYASDIHDSARHALAVINSMLGHGRADTAPADPTGGAATGPQHFAQVDLNQLIEATVSATRPLADKAGVGISACLASRLPHIIADPVSIRQILLNLLTNAIKFTGSGGSIAVETRYDLDGPVAIAVSDTGAGMTAGDIARALDPRHAEAPNPRPGGGLGIGLPLVRQLAEANGAIVRIDSDADAPAATGTTVTVTFARARVVPV